MAKKLLRKSKPENPSYEIRKSHISKIGNSIKALYTFSPIERDDKKIIESNKSEWILQQSSSSRFLKELEKRGILKSPEDESSSMGNERVSDSECTSDLDSDESLHNDLVSTQEEYRWEDELPDYHKETHAVLNKIVKVMSMQYIWNDILNWGVEVGILSQE